MRNHPRGNLHAGGFVNRLRRRTTPAVIGNDEALPFSVFRLTNLGSATYGEPQRSWHCFAPCHVPFETKRCRHRAVAVAVVAIRCMVAVRLCQQGA